MIPKAEILAASKFQELLPTTVQKDYVLGWLLRAIAEHPVLSKWAFKGGTCLKKCFFETYRFSEDLDFTIPKDLTLSVNLLNTHLDEVAAWIESRSGLTFPRQYWKIEEYKNPHGHDAYEIRIPYAGPVGQPAKSLQKVKFDLTQDELMVDAPKVRTVHHGYTDTANPPPTVLCYTINEILAEKTRALVQRNGRSRDVYDVVNISRNFRDSINPDRAREIAVRKFHFRNLESPSVDRILEAIDEGVLRANWQQELAHQINALAPVETFLADLRDALAWWLQPEIAKPRMQPMPHAQGRSVPRILFPSTTWKAGPSALDRIRYAAHNRLCAIVTYNNSVRLVEPYSLRYPATGNENLHVWELEKDGKPVNDHKTYKTHEIESASVSNRPFVPRWDVEI
jgi:predicted nucleotidyltransferase component of viral defense system